MSPRLPHVSLAARIVTMMLVIGLVLLGTLRPSLPEAGARAELAAFMLAGGSLDDLCQDLGEASHQHGDCPACHLHALPVHAGPAVALMDAELAFVAKVVAPRESRAAAMVRDPAHGLRAPPARLA